ncbi:hypothetical protein YC2023_013999 [Brassica napus]
MVILSRSWVATVNHHHANPHSFTTSPTKPFFFLSQKPHVCSSRCSLVLEEDEKKSPGPKQDNKWPFFEPAPDVLNRVLSKFLQDPKTHKVSSEFYEKAKANSELRTTKHLINHLVSSKNWDLLLSLCEDLREYKALPDAHTSSQLIRSCIRQGKFKITHCLLNVFRTDKSLAVSSSDAAMKGFNKLQMYSSTIQVFDRLKQSVGVEPSPGCYCRIMEAHERIGDSQKVVELFQEFNSKRLSFLAKESGSIYTVLCSSLARSGRALEALEFLEEMKDKGIPQSSALYSTLIRALAEAREVVVVEKLFKDAGEKKMLKDPEMCLKVVLMYVREGNMERTLEVVAAMRKGELKVTDCILCAIVNGFCKQRGFAEARMKVLPDKVSYTSMISAYNRAKEFETCVELYHEFRMNRGKIDRAMAGIMVGVFSKTSRIDELMRLLQDMRVERTRLDARLYSSALNALRDAGLNSQIRWLQESFDIAQTSASSSRYSNVKNKRTLQGS